MWMQQSKTSPESPQPSSDGAVLPDVNASASGDVGASVAESATKAASDGHGADFTPMISNDAVIFGLLMAILGILFYASSSKHPKVKFFFKVVPMLLLCYFLPSLLTLFQVVNPKESNIYFVASRYLLPASLVLLTLSIDLKGILRLGPKAVIMFVTGTVGVIIGGPLAILIVSTFNPDLVGGDVWRGLSTVAGSWIGGGANQAAMRAVYLPEGNVDADQLYAAMVAVDVLVAEFWMIFLLLGVGKADAIDRFFKADSSSIEELKVRMQNYSKENEKVATTTDIVVLLAIVFGTVGFCHFFADLVAPALGNLSKSNPDVWGFLSRMSLDSKFFWLVVMSTTIGLVFSFTRIRKFEGVGAMKIGTLFIFILVAAIGMNMDLRAVVQYPGYFLVGLIWMVIHVSMMFAMAWWIRAPYFFLAVGSKANIGGAASAPVVAGAFHPSLAPVGVLLATLGYALGTYGAWVCANFMKAVAPGAS